MVQGSNLLATAPGMLQAQALHGLASARVPLPCPALPMYMIWHLRHHRAPAHRWLRAQLDAVTAEVRQSSGGSPAPGRAPLRRSVKPG